jgi:hypothetical protein
VSSVAKEAWWWCGRDDDAGGRETDIHYKHRVGKQFVWHTLCGRALTTTHFGYVNKIEDRVSPIDVCRTAGRSACAQKKASRIIRDALMVALPAFSLASV